MPAYPGKIKVVINGHERFIKLFGDELNKSAETEDGYTIIQNDNQQWCYAEMGRDSSIMASNWVFGECDSGSEFIDFLNTIPKHLKSPMNKRETNSTSNQKVNKAIGNRKILVILMEYQDLKFTKGQSDYERLFNEEGYNEDNAQGSVRDFYLAASYNQLHLESDIYGPFTAVHNMEYYGKNSAKNKGQDTNAYSLFEEAITNVSKIVDLSLYDGDGDGCIDNVHIIFAGYGEEAGASSNAIWSHESTFYRPYEIQGLKIDRYSCAPELRGNSGTGISRIGPHCHEIGHALGAMDFYDTDNSGGDYLGTGDWDVMASGSWNNNGITPADFNPYVKANNFGWISLKPLPVGEIQIPPSWINPDNYYILKESEYSDYYLLENRSKEKWGSYLPGEGLLIYHVHYDIANAENSINVTAPQMCYIVCASSKNRQPSNSPSSYGDINSSGCPYPGSSSNMNFGQNSTPLAFYWNNTPCGIELDNITLDENGNIFLKNNSIGADYEPIDRRTLLFEGFEDVDNIKIDGVSRSKWQIVDNPENTMTFIDRPIAYEGVKSLQLFAKSMDSTLADTLEFTCNPIGKGKMRVKIIVTSLKLSFNKPNIIKIGYRSTDNPDWQYAEIQSKENNRWRISYIELPLDIDSVFRIIGIANGGSILAIDNLELEQEITTDDTKVRTVNTNQRYPSPNIFVTIDGMQHKKVSTGINIYNTNGKNIKVFVRSNK